MARTMRADGLHTGMGLRDGYKTAKNGGDYLTGNEVDTLFSKTEGNFFKKN